MTSALYCGRTLSIISNEQNKIVNSVLRIFHHKPLKLACSDPEVIKLFSCSIQLCMKFILLINVKMPQVVGILTFIYKQDKWLGFGDINQKFPICTIFINPKFQAIEVIEVLIRLDVHADLGLFWVA